MELLVACARVCVWPFGSETRFLEAAAVSAAATASVGPILSKVSGYRNPSGRAISADLSSFFRPARLPIAVSLSMVLGALGESGVAWLLCVG